MPRSRVAGPKRMHIFIFNRSGQTTLQSSSHNLCAPRQAGTVHFLKRMGIIHSLPLSSHTGTLASSRGIDSRCGRLLGGHGAKPMLFLLLLLPCLVSPPLYP